MLLSINESKAIIIAIQYTYSELNKLHRCSNEIYIEQNKTKQKHREVKKKDESTRINQGMCIT